MCQCVNIEMGSYSNQTVLKPPFQKKHVGIDNCILEEIKALWEKGIVTVESCCGHNKVQGYIMVATVDDTLQMLLFGYEFEEHSSARSFKPKSI